MARESIAMTPDEVRAFLQTRHHVALATVGTDGRPEVTIVPCRYGEDGLELTIALDEPVLATITNGDDRVCCAVEVCPSYYELRGVSLHGKAEPLGGGRVRVHVEHATSFDFGKITDRPA
jgi:predicted pyridoxine 5'-phosphate oxidase superfamily flavin-nucleotide-binding protein